VLQSCRARQTLDLRKLGDQLPPDRIDIADRFYNTGTDTLINAVRELPEDCSVALLIWHAPGAPGVVYELTDPTTSTPEAVSAIDGRFRRLRWRILSSTATGLRSRAARLSSSEYRCRQPLTQETLVGVPRGKHERRLMASMSRASLRVAHSPTADPRMFDGWSKAETEVR
jgi:phosphohistidine phosphatase SixA